MNLVELARKVRRLRKGTCRTEFLALTDLQLMMIRKMFDQAGDPTIVRLAVDAEISERNPLPQKPFFE